MHIQYMEYLHVAGCMMGKCIFSFMLTKMGTSTSKLGMYLDATNTQKDMIWVVMVSLSPV